MIVYYERTYEHAYIGYGVLAGRHIAVTGRVIAVMTASDRVLFTLIHFGHEALNREIA